MFNKNITAVFSCLLLASGVASANPSADVATAPSAESGGAVDLQSCSKPDYPARWINEGASGNVVMDVLVSPDGTVLESKVVQSSGYRYVDHASVRAAERCKLKVMSAQASPSWSRVTYAWVIE